MEQTTQSPRKIRFDVADVSPARDRLPEVSAKAALERTICTRALACGNSKLSVVEAADFHPLIAAAFLAFKQHYPLVLSPDMLWITVLQGVAQHIQNHSESLRKR